MQVAILILNYNGRELLAECLPSLLQAARNSVHACDVIVIDNASTDSSCQYLSATFPEVRVIRCPNEGLCSFNHVIDGDHGDFDYPVAVLLNNDIKLDPQAIDPLIGPFVEGKLGDAKRRPTFLTAPLCWQFDGVTCEGFKSVVGWRWGLVQATGRFPGHQRVLRFPGETACAGAALAVDCHKFRTIGGFDPLYLPGRLEDLDLAFRAWQNGWVLRYVPESIAYHKGQVSFGQAFGQQGCDELALRNTLLFQWKNLRHPRHFVNQLTGGVLRAVRDMVLAPWQAKSVRWSFFRAWAAARQVWKLRKSQPAHASKSGTTDQRSSLWQHIKRERAFFKRFSRSQLLAEARGQAVGYPTTCDPVLDIELGIAPATLSGRSRSENNKGTLRGSLRGGWR